MKQVGLALVAIFDRYRALSAADQRIVDQLMAEHVLSDDEALQFGPVRAAVAAT